jgi:hypothetical protein
VERVPDPASLKLDALWDEEWQKNALHAALRRVKRKVNAKHYQLFDLYAVKRWPVKDIVETLGVSSDQVYQARSATGAYRAVKVVCRHAFDHELPYEREFAGLKQFEPVSRTSESQLDILHVGRNDAAGYFFYEMELADDWEQGQTIVPDSYSPRTLARGSDRFRDLCSQQFSVALPEPMDGHLHRPLSHVESSRQLRIRLRLSLSHHAGLQHAEKRRLFSRLEFGLQALDNIAQECRPMSDVEPAPWPPQS